MAVNGEGAHYFSPCHADTGQTASQKAGGELREGVRMRGNVYRLETEKKREKLVPQYFRILGSHMNQWKIL